MVDGRSRWKGEFDMNRTALALSAAILLVAGLLMILRLQQTRLASDQAGVAYIEKPDGSIEKATGQRAAIRTLAPERNHNQLDPEGSGADWLTDFELTERSGKLVNSRSFRGKPYVVGFFFATCPSVCVRQNEKFKTLQDKFRGQSIRLVEISCDPDVDRPEVLAEYADRFQADPEQWLFFTGKMDYIERVGSEMYSIGIVRRGHPEKFALVDAEGKVYGYYTWSDPAQWQALQADMAKLIAELPK